MKQLKSALLAILTLTSIGNIAKAESWPANYDGVMLQGFYWDAYKTTGDYPSTGTTKWTDLTKQADELSKYFDLIWVPNSGRASGENGGGNGYMPIYWFTNHNCAYGSESELKTMISTFASKGTGIIEDCVINHRVGVSDWADFPTESWNGKTYSMGASDVCSTDEWGKGTGRADEGEDFNGARDLDHTSSNVQNCCKDYVKFLTSSTTNNGLGYAGLRYDMVKGYSGYYTGMYNTYAGVKFSVGEHWSSYDEIAAWINQTAEYGNGAGKSAAFDFPCKYAINNALNGYDENCAELVWKANGTTNQPAGLIHFGYQRYAVTFVDNHDTGRPDNGSRFGNDYHIPAANAFILFSPGTPCIFWPHYVTYKSQIQKLITARKSVGIHNQSTVNVLRAETHLYVAEIIGTKGKAIVKIGSGSYTPASGYTLQASGNGYSVWTTNSGGVDPGNGESGNNGAQVPSNLYILGNLDGANWTPSKGITMAKQGNKFTASNVKLVAASGETNAFFTFVTSLGADWDKNVNSSDRYGATSKDLIVTLGSTNTIKRFAANESTSSAFSWGITPGTYDITADFDSMTMTISSAGSAGETGTGEAFKVYFDNSNSNWTNPYIHYWGSSESKWPGEAMSKHKGNIWVHTVPAGTTGILFNAGDGDKTKTSDFSAIANHLYNASGDKGIYQDASDSGSSMTMPSALYIMGNIGGESNHWNTNYGIQMTKSDNTFVADDVVLEDVSNGVGEPSSYFSFVTKLGKDWDTVNSGDRYGSTAKDAPLSVSNSASMVVYNANGNASSANSWKVTPGKYKITADFGNKVVKLDKATSVSDILIDQDTLPVYFNLQGVRVENPSAGLYIVVRGNKVTKEFVR